MNKIALALCLTFASFSFLVANTDSDINSNSNLNSSTVAQEPSSGETYNNQDTGIISSIGTGISGAIAGAAGTILNTVDKGQQGLSQKTAAFSEWIDPTDYKPYTAVDN